MNPSTTLCSGSKLALCETPTAEGFAALLFAQAVPPLSGDAWQRNLIDVTFRCPQAASPRDSLESLQPLLWCILPPLLCGTGKLDVEGEASGESREFDRYPRYAGTCVTTYRVPGSHEQEHSE